MPSWCNAMVRICLQSPREIYFYLNANANSQIPPRLSSAKYFEIGPFFKWSVAFFALLTSNLPLGLIWLFTLNSGNKSKGKCFSHWAGTMFFWYERSFPLFLKQSFDFLGFPFMTFRRKGNCCWIRDAWDFCFILYFLNIWTLLQDGTN